MPIIRLGRLRKNSATRDWVSQTRLKPADLIMPYFVVEGKDVKKPIVSMPGVYRLSMDNVLKEISEIVKVGIHSVLLFGIARSKDKIGSYAYRNNGVVQKTIKAIKRKFRDLIVITDVCLCGYTSHGHCGILNKNTKYGIDTDATLKILAKIALSHAEAGVDLVAPSAMMDGQVGIIRESLDKNGFKDVGILAYSAKYASGFYGPFREAFDSSPQFGDRKTYQMDFRNSDEALREIRQDINEGADMVMVKPALSYLDIIYRAKKNLNIPLVAYNVSGEYSMVKAYCQRQEEEEKLVWEILTSIKRAGADFIITYWAKDAARWLR